MRCNYLSLPLIAAFGIQVPIYRLIVHNDVDGGRCFIWRGRRCLFELDMSLGWLRFVGWFNGDTSNDIQCQMALMVEPHAFIFADTISLDSRAARKYRWCLYTYLLSVNLRVPGPLTACTTDIVLMSEGGCTPLWKSNRNIFLTQIYYNLFFVVCPNFHTWYMWGGHY